MRCSRRRSSRATWLIRPYNFAVRRAVSCIWFPRPQDRRRASRAGLPTLRHTYNHMCIPIYRKREMHNSWENRTKLLAGVYASFWRRWKIFFLFVERVVFFFFLNFLWYTGWHRCFQWWFIERCCTSPKTRGVRSSFAFHRFLDEKANLCSRRNSIAMNINEDALWRSAGITFIEIR